MTADWDLMEVSRFFGDPPIESDDQEQIKALCDRLITATEQEWEHLDDPYHIQLTGVLYNLAEDFGRREGLDRVIELNERIANRDLADAHESIRHYQLANAYSLRAAWTEESTAYTFFDSQDLIEAIGHARASVADDYRPVMDRNREIQSYVNFANLLSRTGRVCEALVWYNNAIQKNPNHPMALGNRGICKMNYAGLLFSTNHTARFLHSAYQDFKTALEHWDDPHPHAHSNFEARMNAIEDYSDERLNIENQEEYELGETAFDVSYHEWVLKNHLYLNPLNDIFTHTSTAHDFFHLPNMLIPDNEDFPYPGIYNQVKQEFVSARYLYYEGKTKAEESPHFSDRDVKLPDTLDYSVYGYRTEQVKAALRISYSIFDKIALLIDQYFGVGQKQPSFRKVWHKNGDYTQGLAKPFKNSDNWALNALYWIKKDFHHSISKKDGGSVVIVAHELKSLRNAIEHDYIKVFEDGIVSEPPVREWLPDSLYDPIGKSELRKAALQMLRLARSAMIYIALAIHHEERKKKEDHNGVTVPLSGQIIIPDELKE